MIMTDQDQDGSHIKGLVINFMHFFWPELLKVFVNYFLKKILENYFIKNCEIERECVTNIRERVTNIRESVTNIRESV